MAAWAVAGGPAAASAGGSAGLNPETRNRAEIPSQYRWDFSAIFPSWDAWDAAMKEMGGKMDAFAAMKGPLAQGPAAVLKPYKPLPEIGLIHNKDFPYPPPPHAPH